MRKEPNCYDLAEIKFGDGSPPKYGIVQGFHDDALFLDIYDYGFPVETIIRDLPSVSFLKHEIKNRAVKISPDEFI